MRVGIKDVAREAQVSIGTVSKVFNAKSSGAIKISEQTRQRVHEAASKLNYTPNYGATLLRGQSTKTIGFTIALPAEHNRSFLSDYSKRLLDGLGDEASRNGYQLLVVNDKDYPYYMDTNRIDGLVVIGYSLDNNPREKEMSAIFQRFNDEQYPYIVINNLFDKIPIPQINVDTFYGVELAVEHILKKGYRHVGFLGEITPNPQRHHTERSTFLKDLLNRNNLPVDDRIFINGTGSGIPEVPRIAQYSHADGYHGMNYLHENKFPIDCLVCGNDTISLGVFKYAREHNINIPGDMAVIGHDDITNAEYFSPSITTIRQPLEDFGRLAVNYLLKKMRNRDHSESFLIKPELIERESA